MRRLKMIVFGYGSRGRIYADYAKVFPNEYELAAIVENNEERYAEAKRKFSCPVYTDYKDMLAAAVPADFVAIATQDKDHVEHAVACMKAGYDLLLEKPISNTLEGCRRIYEASKEYDKKVVVCHVLRYTPFYRRVKEIIDSGRIGEIVTVHASENVGYYHQAHSFVRGPWRNSGESSPMILAKCCHDMDILRWLIGKPCHAVSSMGSLRHFKKEMAPTDNAKYCSECKVKECLFRAQTLYEKYPGFASYFTRSSDMESILKALKGTQYDKCVYETDNDVVDHQVTILSFEDGVTACHTMTAFSKECYRDIKIYGTKGELFGHMENNYIEVRPFGEETECVRLENEFFVGQHGGGDQGMMHELYLAFNGLETKGVSYLDVSIESHLMAFNAESSRLENGMRKDIEK